MADLKESRYNIWVEKYPSEGFSLVYNTLQRSLLKLPDILVDKIKDGKLNGIPNKLLSILLEANILIEDEIDEMKVIRYWFDRYRLQTEKLFITFLPSYNCNCRCVYCYEDGIRQNMTNLETMPEYLIKKFIKWVADVSKLWHSQLLDFCFHGGEPLLFPNILDSVGKKINELAEEHGLEKEFSIVTNGTLLTDENIGILQKHFFNRALCTLDGIPEVHDSRRPFLNGEGTFSITFSNIKKALDKGMTIILDVNVDHMNYPTLSEFLDFLSKEKMQSYRNFRLVFALVKQGPQVNNPEYFRKYHIKWEEAADVFKTLYNEALKRKLRTAEPIGEGLCSFRTMSNFWIDNKGDIYKCSSLVGNNAAFIGNIQETFVSILRRLSQYLYLIPWEVCDGCKKCKFLPLCFGGCAQQALLIKGSQNEVDCMRPFLQDYMPEVLKIKYDRSMLFPEIMEEGCSSKLKELLRI